MQSPKAPDDVKRQAYDRHAELVDKSFLAQLSSDEQQELRNLNIYLDETEAEFLRAD